MTGLSHPYAPAAAEPHIGGPRDASGGDGAATPRPAHSIPLDGDERKLLVRRAMALHVVSAMDHAEYLAGQGHADTDLIQIEGMREAIRTLEQRRRTRLGGPG